MILNIDRQKLAREANSAALRVRRYAGYSLQDAICVYDIAEKLGIEVRFLDVPSMEGMYAHSPRPHIIVSSLRPMVRQVFTCAHEIAHHRFDHGLHIDEIVEIRSTGLLRNPHEFLADCFAGFLLMPKLAVENAINSRGMDLKSCNPAEIFKVSNWFGVGYSTLINHMCWGLRVMSEDKAKSLLRVRPKQIKASILEREVKEGLVVVENNWISRPIDLAKDDYMLVLSDVTVEGNSIQNVADIAGGKLFQASRPGICRIEDDEGWASFVRVSRKEYMGRSIFRHLEEVDDE